MADLQANNSLVCPDCFNDIFMISHTALGKIAKCSYCFRPISI